MTIEEAIKDLENFRLANMLTGMMAHDDAIKLGIEALKRIKVIRHTIYSDLTSLLSGETNED